MVLVHRVATLLHASFEPRLATTPFRFANPSPPSGWIEDFHLQAVDHARHTEKAPPKRGKSQGTIRPQFGNVGPSSSPQTRIPDRNRREPTMGAGTGPFSRAPLPRSPGPPASTSPRCGTSRIRKSVVRRA